jgi:hypothetical protein
MSEDIKHSDVDNDQRRIIIDGRRYFTMTANKCTVCSGDGRYMYLKQKHTGGCVTLECPNCDNYITLLEEMVNYNLNR